MLDPRNRLFVFFDDNSSFSDFSNEAQDYARDTFALPIVAADDFLYVGFTKPINSFYIEMSTANTATTVMSIDSFKEASSTFTAVTGFSDETNGFTRSGFIRWDRATKSANDIISEETTTINSQLAFWYRISFSIDLDVGTIAQGLNLVLADDNDIKNRDFELVSDTRKFPGSQTSHILTHVAARDAIMQLLKRREFLTRTSGSNFVNDLLIWDLMDSSQLREAATWKAIALIYDNLSDKVDDKESEKSGKALNKFKMAFDLYLLEVDANNDGVTDPIEQDTNSRTVIMGR